MPNISSMSLSSPTVDSEEIYSEGLYAPANPPDSLEILNGGLDRTNYGEALSNTLPVWTTKIGSFAAGFYSGFDTWDFVYAAQMSNADRSAASSDKRVVHSSLCSKVFLPWDASVVLYGFQAYFRHDATYRWYGLAPTDNQFWDFRVTFDGAVNQALYTKLARSRADQTALDDAQYAHEEYWPYVTKQAMQTNVSKGYRSITTSVWAEIGPVSNRVHNEKLLTPSGALWVLAIR